jgi:Tfp pilus assembly protein PilN
MKRLPVNLASNPIEQRRRLRRITSIALGSALLMTALHAALGWSLMAAPAPEVAPDAAALAELRAAGNEVLGLATGADPRVARRIAVSVGLANALIEQRVFPWAGLFAMLEETLPDDVRLELIQPLAALDGVRLTLTAASGSGDALLVFLGALERRPELLAVYPGRQLVGPDGDLRLSIEAIARIGGAPAAPSGGNGQ